MFQSKTNEYQKFMAHQSAFSHKRELVVPDKMGKLPAPFYNSDSWFFTLKKIKQKDQ